ncbi:formylglycine-generating enzyme family protein [Thermodesulfobacteriota bacterium]
MNYLRIFLMVGLGLLMTGLPGTDAAGAAYFEQVNRDGFGKRHCTGGLETKTMQVFKGKLYVGVSNKVDGAQVWSFDGTRWTQVNKNGFGTRKNTAVASMAVSGERLFAGTTNRDGGQIWAYDGSSWRCLHTGAFGETLSKPIQSLAVYRGRLYVGLWDQATSRPAEVWAFDGEASWELVSQPGFGSPHNITAVAMETAVIAGEERLYAAVWKSFQYKGADAGCEVWAYDEKQWQKINPGREGFGLPGKGRSGVEPYSLAAYKGRLYVGLWAFEAGWSWEVWAWDGHSWEQAKPGTDGQDNSLRLCIAMQSYNNYLWAIMTDAFGLFELLAYDGSDWQTVVGKNGLVADKFGDQTNKVGNAMGVYNGSLYLGVVNNKSGYRVFRSSLPATLPQQTAVLDAGASGQPDNKPPAITSLAVSGGRFDVQVLFELQDPDGDRCHVTAEYRTGAGRWLPASIASGSGQLQRFSDSERVQNVLQKLTPGPSGNPYVLVWQPEKDIGEQVGTFYLRLTPSDRRKAGAPAVSAPIVIDNAHKPPSEMVYVPEGDFSIDKYEYPNRPGSYPVVSLTWEAAREKCLAQGKDLCTPQQWEAAYYGNVKKSYPYGDTYGFQERDFCNTSGSTDDVVVPSGLYEACVNDLGLYDMGGNVYEWVGTDTKSVFMADQSYMNIPMNTSLINVEDPTHRHRYLGQRCCRPGKAGE